MNLKLVLSQLQLLSNEPVVLEDIVPDEEELDEDTRQDVQTLIDSFADANLDVLQCASDKMQFIEKFYRSNDNKNFSFIAISLSIFLDNSDAIDDFLLQHVDFTSFESIEHKATISRNYKSTANLNEETRSLWHALNAKHGSKAIKLFMLAADLDAIECFDLPSIVDSAGGVEKKEVIDAIKIFAKKVSYYQGEDENAARLAELCGKYNIPKRVFEDAAKNVLPKAKTSDLLPNIKFDFQAGKKLYAFEKLVDGDVTGLVLGEVVGCCQSIGNMEHNSAVSGFTRKDAVFYVIRDSNGKICAQTYAWIGLVDENQVIVWDSFEFFPGQDKLFLGAAKEFSRMIKAESGGAANEASFSDLYVGSGGKTPKLSISPVADVTKLNEDLHRSTDSTSLYKITQEVTLSASSENHYNFNSYEEYALACPHQSALKLMDYINQLDVEITDNAKHYLLRAANLNWILISENILTSEKLIEYNENGVFCYFNGSDQVTLGLIQETLAKFANAPIDQLREFMNNSFFLYSSSGQLGLKLIKVVLQEFDNNQEFDQDAIDTMKQLSSMFSALISSPYKHELIDRMFEQHPDADAAIIKQSFYNLPSNMNGLVYKYFSYEEVCSFLELMNVKGILSSLLWQRNEDALKLIKSYIDKADNKEFAFNLALELPYSENVYKYFSYEEIFSLLEICDAKGWKHNLDYKEDDALKLIKSYLDQAEDKEAALENIGKLSHVDIENNELVLYGDFRFTRIKVSPVVEESELLNEEAELSDVLQSPDNISDQEPVSALGDNDVSAAAEE
ncbi:MAG: hypothetical protein P8P83_00060 [Rickettsiaceae bacterium]|nr:hypothetical protein [Rickettsiaceae bacterium]